MRLTLKTLNDEFKRLGHDVELEKGDGYFYFQSGEAASWLDKTVRVPTLSSLTLEQWVDEFNRLKKVNEDILQGQVGPEAPKPKSSNEGLRKK